MDGREKREELAARIKAGEKSLLPMLWGECRGTVIIMAAKYRSIIEQNAFVDMEDFIQCGYFAMLEAVEAYNPEKGYKFHLIHCDSSKYTFSIIKQYTFKKCPSKNLILDICFLVKCIIYNIGIINSFFHHLAGNFHCLL